MEGQKSTLGIASFVEYAASNSLDCRSNASDTWEMGSAQTQIDETVIEGPCLTSWRRLWSGHIRRHYDDANELTEGPERIPICCYPRICMGKSRRNLVLFLSTPSPTRASSASAALSRSGGPSLRVTRSLLHSLRDSSLNVSKSLYIPFTLSPTQLSCPMDTNTPNLTGNLVFDFTPKTLHVDYSSPSRFWPQFDTEARPP